MLSTAKITFECALVYLFIHPFSNSVVITILLQFFSELFVYIFFFPWMAGRRCQSRFSVCESQPCQNGGACLASAAAPQGYTCTCQLVSALCFFFKNPPSQVESDPTSNCQKWFATCRATRDPTVSAACPAGSCCATTAAAAR